MTMQDTSYPLINALLRQKHRALYLHSGLFHSEIKLMAKMIPIIVDALAVSAEEEDQQIKAQMRMIEETPQARFMYPGSALWDGDFAGNPGGDARF